MAKPVVCQIHGGCIGGALETALACDLRVMAADAVVGLPETRIGLIPDVGGSSRLPQVVGLGRAKELIMTGELIGGRARPSAIGLVNRVAPADGAGGGHASSSSTSCWSAPPWPSGWPSASSTRAPVPRCRPRSSWRSRCRAVCAATEDFAEGAQAFAAKRQPSFRGR